MRGRLFLFVFEVCQDGTDCRNDSANHTDRLSNQANQADGVHHGYHLPPSFVRREEIRKPDFFLTSEMSFALSVVPCRSPAEGADCRQLRGFIVSPIPWQTRLRLSAYIYRRHHAIHGWHTCSRLSRHTSQESLPVARLQPADFCIV